MVKNGRKIVAEVGHTRNVLPLPNMVMMTQVGRCYSTVCCYWAKKLSLMMAPDSLELDNHLQDYMVTASPIRRVVLLEKCRLDFKHFRKKTWD